MCVVMRIGFLSGVFTLLASLSLASDLPDPITHPEFPVPGATSVLLGRDLFFDPILSGNRNISCASCHNPLTGTSDAVSLSLGEGGTGLGLERKPDPVNTPHDRIARNAPALYNLGAHEFTSLLHDGRVEADHSLRFRIRLPNGLRLERPVPSVLAAQALMPLVSADEMAGQPGENEIADAIAAGRVMGLNGAWQKIAARIEATPEYRRRFDWLIGADEPIHITDIARVLSDFMSFEFRATDSPFDAFLRGDDSALSNAQLHGMSLFYGKAGCGTCHSGPFQTDHAFHAIGLPQIGPGKGHGAGYADHGRGAITGAAGDLYRFRTPSLRNVTLTAPYGHNGAFADLEAMIRHHLDAETSLAEYDLKQARLPAFSGTIPDARAMEDFDEVLAITAAIGIAPVRLSEAEIEALVAFLGALTDPVSLTGRLGIPDTVPSGLPVELLAAPPS